MQAELDGGKLPKLARDPNCLSALKHYYRSLMPMAQEARKPMLR